MRTNLRTVFVEDAGPRGHCPEHSRASQWPSTGRPWLGLAAGLALLTLQNLLYFWRHYFAGWSIPWDFLASYHAAPQFWIEAARLGVPAGWVPFQGMGYPLYMNLQSGLHYPPFWLFVAADQPYTVEAAVVMQGLHVLFGAIGAGLCARLMGLRWLSALLAAVLYQGFGGFYSNASHPDIVRAYAVLPWLCAPFLAQWRTSRLLTASTALVPLWVYALWTGGYPGGVVAQLFVVGMVLLVRLAGSVGKAEARRHGLPLAWALLTGVLLAGLSLVPATLDRLEIARATGIAGLHHEYLGWKGLLAPVLRVDNNFFDHDVTMRSWSIAMPALALLFMRPFLGRLREAAIPALVGLLALGMACGILHRPLAWLLPPLGYSRFVLADYKALLALMAVLLAVQSFQLLVEGTRPVQRLRYSWLALLTAYLAVAAYTVYGGAWASGRDLAMLASAGVATALLLAVVQRQVRAPSWALAGLIALCAMDWARVHWDAGYFQSPDAKASLEKQMGSLDRARGSLVARLAQPPACRPARIHVAATDIGAVPWRGYYTGDYLSQDYAGAANLARPRKIVFDKDLYRFALQPWTALVLTGKPDAPPQQVVAGPMAPVQCLHYGTTQLEYQVTLSQPTTVVENELYWPGWTAQVPGRRIAALDANGFRAWALPAGQYRMTADFRPPWRREGMLVVALGALSWCALLVMLARNRRHG